jgi:hypothetical protein
VITATGTTTATATCPPGHPFATGGGFAVNPALGNNNEVRISQPVGGSPTTPATGWTVTFQPGVAVTAYAICSS